MEEFFNFQFKKEVKLLPLFLNQSFRAVAMSLISLFSSIYIYKILLPLVGRESLALLGVFLFFLVRYSFNLIGFLLAEELSLKMGLKKLIYLGLFFLSLSLISFFLSSRRLLWLYFTPFLWGLAVGFYWFGRHGLIIKIGRQDAFGKQLGIARSVVTVFLVGVPFLGGALISLAGYQGLFLASLIFVFLAFITLRSVKEEKTHYDTNLVEILNLFKTHKKSVLAYLGNATAFTIYAVAIPLYIFLILQKELSLGEFFSLSLVLVALIDLIVGRWVDIKGKRGVIRLGAVTSFLIWLGRFFTPHIGGLFVFDVLDRVTAGMSGIPLEVLTYEKALDGHSTGRAVLFREVAISFGSIFACICLAILLLLEVELKFSFLVAGVFSLLPLLILKKKS